MVIRALIFCILTAWSLISQATNTITQNVYGEGTSNIFFKSIDPTFKLSFKSQTTYVDSLAPFSQLNNPKLISWMHANGKSSTKKLLSSTELEFAYTRFLQGKATLEYDPCINLEPTFREDDAKQKYKCISNEKIVSSIELLNESFDVIQNSWTQLYRGIAYARLRSFLPALQELNKSEVDFRRMGLIAPADYARQYRIAVLKWNDDQAARVVLEGTVLKCPETPEKTREALGQDMGTCTLLFCGKWTGYDDQLERRKVIPAVIANALTPLHGKGHPAIAKSAAYQCALLTRDKDNLIQANIDKSLLDFANKSKYYDKLAEHHFRLVEWMLANGQEGKIVRRLEMDLPVLLKQYKRGDLALRFATDKQTSLPILEQQLKILGIKDKELGYYLKLKRSVAALSGELDPLLTSIESRLRKSTAAFKYLRLDLFDSTKSDADSFRRFLEILDSFKQPENQSRLIDEAKDIAANILIGLNACEASPNVATLSAAYQDSLISTMSLPSQREDMIRFARFWREHQSELNEFVLKSINVASQLSGANVIAKNGSCVASLGLFALERLADTDISSLELAITMMDIFNTSSDSPEKSVNYVVDSYNKLFTEGKSELQLNSTEVNNYINCAATKSNFCARMIAGLGINVIKSFLPKPEDYKNKTFRRELFIAILERATSYITKSALDSITGFELAKKCFEKALQDIIDDKLSFKANRNEIVLLGALRANFRDSNVSLKDFPKLLLGNHIDDLALATVAFLANKANEPIHELHNYLIIDSLRQIRSPPALLLLLSNPGVLANLTPTEVTLAYEHLKAISGLSGDMFIRAATTLIMNDSVRNRNLVDYSKIKVIAELHKVPHSNLEIKLPVQSEEKWLNVLKNIKPAIVIANKNESLLGGSCESSNCSIKLSTQFTDDFGAFWLTKRALVHTASAENSCENLSSEFYSIQDIQPSILPIQFLEIIYAEAAGYVLNRSDCSTYSQKFAAFIASEVRYIDALKQDVRVRLLRGLIPDPFTLKSLRWHYATKEEHDKIHNLLPLLNIHAGMLITDDVLFEAATRVTNAHPDFKLKYRIIDAGLVLDSTDEQ